MARNSARSKHKQTNTAPPKSSRPKPDAPGVQTLDPATEKEINGLFMTLLRRLGVTVIVMMVTSLGVVTLAHATHNATVGVFFLSVLIGLLISFWRNVEKVFIAVKNLGIARYKQRRYADAAFALEHFHRLGNMSFDRDGEAHYYLARAYVGLNQADKAAVMADWLLRHRSRAPYAQRAAEAVAAARIAVSSQI